MKAIGDNYPKPEVSQEQRKFTKKAINNLLGVNAVSAALSIVNEVVLGHSALGFNQFAMEVTDTGLAAGLKASEKNDAFRKHKRASRQRIGLYGLHIATASIGIAEGVRLVSLDAKPSVANMAVAGVVGVLNVGYIRHKNKHHKKEAHTTIPDTDMAFEDPIEVIQDEIYDYPSAEIIHQLNDNGTTAIAHTNIAEAAGGVLGAGSQFFWEQGSAAGAILSSVAVIGIMAHQIWRERSVMSERISQSPPLQPVCLNEVVQIQ